ncbi:MAG: hypothetical protein KAS05_01995 [Candidatus Omnitrophica bacterium]|nr:hypothetical protein [Candidatus Omnitrophota bacterium]
MRLFSKVFCFFLILAIPLSSFAQSVTIDGVTISDPQNPSPSEIVSWTSTTVGVSKEILEAYYGGEYTKLGKTGDFLTVIGIGEQIYQAKDKEAFLSALSFVTKRALDNFLKKNAPGLAGTMAKIGTFQTALTAYKLALELINRYVWLPYLKDEVYKAYKSRRDVLVDPWESFYSILYFTEPVMVDVKAKIRKEKYDLGEKDLTDKFKQKISKEAEEYIVNSLEKRYIEENLIMVAELAGGVATEKKPELVKTIKKDLKIVIRGKVINQETKKPIKNAKVGIKDKRYNIHSRPNGSFELTVPYSLTDGKPFKVFAELEDSSEEKKLSWQMKKIPFITFKLNAQCQPNWQCADWKPRCQGEVYMDSNNIGDGKVSEVTRSCSDQNGCNLTKDKPQDKALCVTEVRDTPASGSEAFDALLAQLDAIKPRWIKAFNDYYDAMRKHMRLRDEFRDENKHMDLTKNDNYDKYWEMHNKIMKPLEENQGRFNKIYDSVDSEYSEILRAATGIVFEKQREYLEVNQQWKDAIHAPGNGNKSAKIKSLKKEWQRIEAEEYKPLSKLRLPYHLFRREYVEKYEKKYNYETYEIKNKGYRW